RQRMRRAEFAGPRAELAPLLDELAIARELHDPRIGVGARTRELAAVSVRDEDVAIGCRDDVVRLVERVSPPRPHTWLAQPQEHLPIRAELRHRVALSLRIRARRELALVRRAAVG